MMAAELGAAKERGEVLAGLYASQYPIYGRFGYGPAAEGATRIVLRVVDKDGYADGTFALDGSPDGASCVPTTESPEVTLPAAVLASIYLGGFSAARYAVLGQLDEHRPGAVARLAAMFRTAIAPWGPTGY